MSEPHKQTFEEIIRVYLPLTIVVIGAAITWGVFTNKIASAEARITATEVHGAKIDETLTELLVGQASMASDLKFLTKQYK